jgi:hypothetical protein
MVSTSIAYILKGDQEIVLSIHAGAKQFLTYSPQGIHGSAVLINHQRIEKSSCKVDQEHRISVLMI